MAFDIRSLPIPAAQLLQKALIQEGLYSGTTRGIPGPKTIAAYNEYVRRHLNETQEDSSEPGWLRIAKTYEGTREIVGSRHNPLIIKWAEMVGHSWVRTDEVAWCASAVGGILEEFGIRSTRSLAARSYMKWGIDVSAKKPVGSVVVFWRGSRSGWKGHVAFLVGMSASGNPICLGGNQSNGFNVKEFPKERVLGYRWPLDRSMGESADTLIAGEFEISQTEA